MLTFVSVAISGSRYGRSGVCDCLMQEKKNLLIVCLKRRQNASFTGVDG